MIIPKRLKVGGKTYKVIISDKLELGTASYSAEIQYQTLTITITPAAQQKMEADFIHEMVHAIHAHLGYSEHDEKKIDELANALHMVIRDNPKLFAHAAKKKVTK